MEVKRQLVSIRTWSCNHCQIYRVGCYARFLLLWPYATAHGPALRQAQKRNYWLINTLCRLSCVIGILAGLACVRACVRACLLTLPWWHRKTAAHYLLTHCCSEQGENCTAAGVTVLFWDSIYRWHARHATFFPPAKPCTVGKRV